MPSKLNRQRHITRHPFVFIVGFHNAMVHVSLPNRGVVPEPWSPPLPTPCSLQTPEHQFAGSAYRAHPSSGRSARAAPPGQPEHRVTLLTSGLVVRSVCQCYYGVDMLTRAIRASRLVAWGRFTGGGTCTRTGVTQG